MKVALTHDVLTTYGGAEKVLEELHLMFPEAPIHTSIYAPENFPERLRSWDVRTSWMSRIPLAERAHRALFMLYPFAMNAFDLDEYDLVISSSYNFAHHVAVGTRARHVCYCHSPARFLWDAHGYARRERLGRPARALHLLSLPVLRALDRAAAQGVDGFVSTSRLVEERIRRCYGRSSEIVPPPIDMAEFHIAERPPDQPYYLLLMRLVGWKRPDIVIDACTRLGLPLVVAGTGRSHARLARGASPNVCFMGQVDGPLKSRLLAECQALILPSSEDFGITPLEAMASGRPVIALRAGGALDTMVEGETGAFFDEQTVESLAAALSRFDPAAYDPARLRKHAGAFDRSNFQRRLRKAIDAVTGPSEAPAEPLTRPSLVAGLS